MQRSCYMRGGRFWQGIGPLLIQKWFLSGAARCNGKPPAVSVYDGKTVGHRVLTCPHKRAPDMDISHWIWERQSDGGRAEKVCEV